MKIINNNFHYEVGDQVIAQYSGNQLFEGRIYTVTRATGSDSAILVSGHGRSNWYILQKRVRIAGNCYKCIHACKMGKECPLFEEE